MSDRKFDPAPQQNIPAGVLWMILTNCLFVAVSVSVRYAGSGLPATQAAFLRYLFGAVLMIFVLRRLVSTPPHPRDLKVFAARGIVHGLAVLLWFYAIAHIPIGEVTALIHSTPLFVTIGAALFLGEKLHFHRIGAVVLGFIGTLIILRPGFSALQIGQWAGLGAAPLFALSFLIAKKMSGKYDALTNVALLSFFCTMILAPVAFLNWQSPSLHEVMILLLTAILATAAHYAMMQAFKYAPITVTQPLVFVQLIFAALAGYLFFAEPFDPFILLGGFVIVIAASYLVRREVQSAKSEQIAHSLVPVEKAKKANESVRLK